MLDFDLNYVVSYLEGEATDEEIETYGEPTLEQTGIAVDWIEQRRWNEARLIGEDPAEIMAQWDLERLEQARKIYG